MLSISHIHLFCMDLHLSFLPEILGERALNDKYLAPLCGWLEIMPGIIDKMPACVFTARIEGLRARAENIVRGMTVGEGMCMVTELEVWDIGEGEERKWLTCFTNLLLHLSFIIYVHVYRYVYLSAPLLLALNNINPPLFTLRLAISFAIVLHSVLLVWIAPGRQPVCSNCTYVFIMYYFPLL